MVPMDMVPMDMDGCIWCGMPPCWLGFCGMPGAMGWPGIAGLKPGIVDIMSSVAGADHAAAWISTPVRTELLL